MLLDQTSQPSQVDEKASSQRRALWPLVVLVLGGGVTVVWTALLALAFVNLAVWMLS
jgi:hypothetical protein